MSRLASVVAEVERNSKKLTPEQIEKASKALDLTFDEHFVMQNAKSRAHAGGKISTDNAMFLYQALGNTPDHFNRQSFATKYVVTKMLHLIMKEQVVAV